jgi:hypothetical protein
MTVVPGLFLVCSWSCSYSKYLFIYVFLVFLLITPKLMEKKSVGRYSSPGDVENGGEHQEHPEHWEQTTASPAQSQPAEARI